MGKLRGKAHGEIMGILWGILGEKKLLDIGYFLYYIYSMRKLTIAFLVFLATLLLIHGTALILLDLGVYWLWILDSLYS